ncbi:putative vacuolar cation/proton exchanger 2 [Rhizodiscina lignyota]|uniref:Vacuolar calcium ion transporter n=1 Tax=Rhizodiscina lignyota TaxID=1504668 RepID=A0A9P4IEB8_9PEZI|nr:putative vacuolar cation/proton exchanger 2 [Rhizodiscina lignyota]
MARHSAEEAPEPEPKADETVPPHRDHRLPFHRTAGQHTPWIKPDGESYRSGIHPLKFLAICGRSSNKVSAAVNVFWPAVPAALALHWARPDWHLAIFILSYIAMVPAANLIGFAGQELARKLPKVFGVILETTLGSVVEIILFVILIATIKNHDDAVRIIKAAILGSILANLLLCLGLCFLVGGIKRDEQKFHEAVSEVGSGLMLVAGMGLVIPSAFSAALRNDADFDTTHLGNEVLKISRATAIMLLVAFLVYVFFQMRSHHGIYDELLEIDEQNDEDRHKDLAKAKLTFTECVLALVLALTFVALIADFLVNEIEWLVNERNVPDAFMGLILVPIVEKAAEHLTAIDEAWDNQMNFALSHVLGASIQTALLNTPIIVIVGWGLDIDMDLNFEVFDAVVLILAILVVGNFLRDGKSNYLEGYLCLTVYIMIAVSAYYYPDRLAEKEGTTRGEETVSPTAEAAKMAVRLLARGAGVDL